MARSKLVKIVAYNIVVFVALISIMELGLTAIYQIKDELSDSNNIEDPRVELPNYEGVPWASQYWKDHHQRRSEYKSHVGWKYKELKTQTINIDNDGFRVSVTSVELLDSSDKVVFLGGSTMWGNGSNDENTIPSLFSALSSLDVKNLGQSSYCAYQSLILLQVEVSKGLIPDLVISYDGVNNTPLNRGYFQHKREEQFQDLVDGADRQGAGLFKAFSAIQRLTNSISNRLWAKRIDAVLKDSSTSKDEDHLAAIELLETWLTMKQFCEARGIEFICILQPHAFVGNPDVSHFENTAMKSIWKRHREKGYAYYQDIYELMKTSKYDELQASFLDLTNCLDGLPKVYVDFCHLSPNGNAQVAEELYEFTLKK